jgi:hypothetical protein
MIELGEPALIERRSNGGLQLRRTGWAREAAGKTSGQQRKGRDIQADLPLLGGPKPPHPEGERPVYDDGA